MYGSSPTRLTDASDNRVVGSGSHKGNFAMELDDSTTKHTFRATLSNEPPKPNYAGISNMDVSLGLWKEKDMLKYENMACPVYIFLPSFLTLHP
jgi:hypothetical protein